MKKTGVEVKSIFLTKISRTFSRFKRNEQGVTAIEFAFVAGPFFLLLFAIIEVSLFFFASQLLESSVDAVTRKIRTGQLTGISSKEEFKDELCKEIPALIDCKDKSKIFLDVQVAASFDAFEAIPEVDDKGKFKPEDFKYVSAGPRQIIKVTAIYEWPIFTNYAAPLMSNSSSNQALIIASAVVRTEPF